MAIRRNRIVGPSYRLALGLGRVVSGVCDTGEVDPCAVADDSRARRHTSPAVFGVLELPFSAAVGFLQIAIPYDFARRGVPLAAIAALSAVAFLPHAWKFLWIPLLDAGPRRRTWYILSSAFTGLALLAVALFPDPVRHIGLFTALVTASQVGAATSSASVDALMALTAAPHEKARAGGFKMAGNVGGIGLLGTLPIVVGSTRLGEC